MVGGLTKLMQIIPKEKIEEALKDGWLPVMQLSQKVGATYYKVNQALIHHGILRGRKPTTRNRIREGNRAFKVLGYIMANPEMSLQAVGKKFNCTREFVSQIEAMGRNEGIIK